MPVGRLLIGVSHRAQGRLVEGPSHELQGDRQAAAGKAAGHAEGRKAEIADRARILRDAQHHRRHILAAADIDIREARRRDRQGRRQQHVAVAKGRGAIVPKERVPHAQRLEIARRRLVEAELDPAAHHVAVILGAIDQPLAVDRRRFRRQRRRPDQVHLLVVGHVRLDHLRPGIGEDSLRRRHRGRDAGVEIVVVIGRGNADPQTRHRCAARGFVGVDGMAA